MKHSVMLVAGEPSGDELASELAGEMRSIEPEIEIFGAVGPRSRSVGIESVMDTDTWSVVGITSVAKAVPKFLNRLSQLTYLAEQRRPDVVILIDFPEFNLKLAKRLKERGQKVIYYVSPQLWAWRKYRRRTLRDHVDLVISILPFEKKWFNDHGVYNVEYVGNPIVERIVPNLTKKEFCEKHGLDSSRPIVALLPGSRRKEIKRNFPIMLETAGLMHRKEKRVQFVAALNAGITRSELSEILGEGRKKGAVAKFTLVAGETLEALRSADVAAITSGTATLEAGMMGTPMAIVHKAANLDYMLLRPLIDVDHFGLINLIAGERAAKELIQDDFTPDALAAELFRLLRPTENKRNREALRKVAERLGQGGASRRAALAVMKVIDLSYNASS